MELLVKRAMNGDGESFIQLMETYRESMLKVAWGFFSNQEDVADAMQQTILNAYEHIGELKKINYFNNCTQLYNSQKPMADQEEATDQSYFDTYPGENSFFDLLSLLERKDRVIFQLYFGEEYTTREIGEFLGIKESTVRSRIHRGKEQIRKQIQREEWA